MILIDHKDRRPIYEQIIERFQQMILCLSLIHIYAVRTGSSGE